MASPETGIFIQARTNSSRLPGKIFEVLPGETRLSIIEHIYRRMNSIQGNHALAVLVPEDDDRLISFCRNRGMEYITGPALDVRKRYRIAAEKTSVDTIVRVTGDNPCVDPRIASHTIERIHDLRSDLFSYSNLPLGVAVEAFSREALFDEMIADRPEYLEHVSLHIKHNPAVFSVVHENHSVMGDLPAGLPRLTVDTLHDLEVIRNVYSNLGEEFTLEEVLSLYNRNPDLFTSNRHVQQLEFPVPGHSG